MATYIIGEAGVNHNGDIRIAKELIDVAKDAGCDCVKFQTFHAENLVTRQAKKAAYQAMNTKNDHSQFEMLKKLELSYEDFAELKDYCDKVQIDFMSTPFDVKSVDMLEHLQIGCYKISSGDITNKQLLEYIAEKSKPLILSTGMSTLEEVEEAIAWIEGRNNQKITLLHCTSNYPTPYNEVNMRAMRTLAERFAYPVGYSDHTEGIIIPIMAVAVGATVIEKHFTLDKDMEGPDHKASLNPQELKEMVYAVRNVEAAMGDGRKQPTETEQSTKIAARKSIVVNQDLPSGTILRLEHLDIKRPGTGIPPKYLLELVGRKLVHNIQQEQLITWEDILP